METISLSPLELASSNQIRRTIPRPPHLRQPDYEHKYDFLTVFYDCFESADANWRVLIGPPLLNLEPIVLQAIPSVFRCRSSAGVSLRNLIACTQLWLQTAESHAVLAPGLFHQDHISIQPNHCDLFRGKKVLLTKSKDNDLCWINDWVHFFARKHGSNAVLFYDNASTRYETSEIYETISSVPGIDVAVIVHWPFKFGPVGSESFHGPQGLPWDSNYSQFGILEHARHRFLSHAEAVVNADVDELVLTRNKDSVFELLSRSATGYLDYPGYWIEGATESTRNERRHFDFVYRSAAPTEVTPPKWTVAPHRCPRDSQWWVHQVSGMQPDALSSEVSFRHFRAISTGWKYPRGEVKRPNEQDFVKDEKLAAWMREFNPTEQEALANHLIASREAPDDAILAGRLLVREPILDGILNLTWRRIRRLMS